MEGNCLVGGSATSIQLARWYDGSYFDGHVLGNSNIVRTFLGKTNRASRSAIYSGPGCNHLRGDGKCLLHWRMDL